MRSQIQTPHRIGPYRYHHSFSDKGPQRYAMPSRNHPKRNSNLFILGFHRKTLKKRSPHTIGTRREDQKHDAKYEGRLYRNEILIGGRDHEKSVRNKHSDKSHYRTTPCSCSHYPNAYVHVDVYVPLNQIPSNPHLDPCLFHLSATSFASCCVS